jgi:hypothetical protein
MERPYGGALCPVSLPAALLVAQAPDSVPAPAQMPLWWGARGGRVPDIWAGGAEGRGVQLWAVVVSASARIMSITLIRPELRRALIGGAELPAWIRKHSRSDYIVAVAMSAPPWVDRKALRRLQTEARRLTRVTGRQHVLDHIVPITHPYVCGLTVPWNLRVVPEAVNRWKGNKWSPDQVDAFEGPEQFNLFLEIT